MWSRNRPRATRGLHREAQSARPLTVSETRKTGRGGEMDTPIERKRESDPAQRGKRTYEPPEDSEPASSRPRRWRAGKIPGGARRVPVASADLVRVNSVANLTEWLFERTTSRHIPLSVHIDLTMRCNERCLHCYR